MVMFDRLAVRSVRGRWPEASVSVSEIGAGTGATEESVDPTGLLVISDVAEEGICSVRVVTGKV